MATSAKFNKLTMRFKIISNYQNWKRNELTAMVTRCYIVIYSIFVTQGHVNLDRSLDKIYFV